MKIKIAIVLMCMMPSCWWYMDLGENWDYRFNDTELQAEFNIETEYIETVEEAIKFVALYVDYKSESGDRGQSPEETYRLATGDCEDFVFLAMYALYNVLGIESHHVGVKVTKFTSHSLLYVNNRYYEAQNTQGYYYTGQDDPWWHYGKIKYRENYGLVMWRVEQ